VLVLVFVPLFFFFFWGDGCLGVSQVMHVYKDPVDRGGVYWIRLMHHLRNALVIAQMTAGGVFGLKHAYTRDGAGPLFTPRHLGLLCLDHGPSTALSLSECRPSSCRPCPPPGTTPHPRQLAASVLPVLAQAYTVLYSTVISCSVVLLLILLTYCSLCYVCVCRSKDTLDGLVQEEVAGEGSLLAQDPATLAELLLPRLDAPPSAAQPGPPGPLGP